MKEDRKHQLARLAQARAPAHTHAAHTQHTHARTGGPAEAVDNGADGALELLLAWRRRQRRRLLCCVVLVRLRCEGWVHGVVDVVGVVGASFLFCARAHSTRSTHSSHAHTGRQAVERGALHDARHGVQLVQARVRPLGAVDVVDERLVFFPDLLVVVLLLPGKKQRVWRGRPPSLLSPCW